MHAMLLLTLATAGLADTTKPLTLDVWPGKPPGAIAAVGEKADTTGPKGGMVAGKRVIRLGNVSKPNLTVYRPAKEKDTGAAVLVCPGGAYSILALDLEGTEVCEWLNSLGVTGILLEYRVPAPKMGERHGPALMDAQRAVRLVRSRAAELGIDPKRIGILGFSAGGHLAAMTATSFERPAYEAMDAVDEQSCRPDFAILVYPAYLHNAKKDGLADNVKVTGKTPPTFLAHAGNDPVSVESSVFLYLALKKAGVPAALHVWPTGGHGYGLRKTEEPCTRWPERAAEWLSRSGLLKR